MSNQRIKWIDEIRGMAMVLVVLGHVIGGLNTDLGGGEENILRQIVYSFHMPLMFIVSGMVGGGQKLYLDFKDFFKKTSRLVMSLYIPYLIWGYLFWVTKYFIYAGNESVTLKQGRELFWNYSGWIPGWFLLVLLFIKVIDLILIGFIHNDKVKIGIWILMFILGGWCRDIYLISNILKYGIYYQIGKCIKSASLRDNSIINCKNCFVLLMITILFRFAGDLNYFMDFGIAVSVSFLMILLFSQTENHSTILETIGASSMVTYVLHPYMTIPVRIVLQICNFQDFALFVIAETGVAVIGSLIVIKCMNRNKWIKYLFYPGNLLRR